MTLKGLKEFGVIVTFDDQAKELLNPETAQTSIELKLRQNGLTVRDSAFPMVRLSFGARKAAVVQLAGFTMILSVYDIVYLPPYTGPNSRMALVSIWQTSTVGLVGVNNQTALKEVVNEVLERFLNAYLTANPRIR